MTPDRAKEIALAYLAAMEQRDLERAGSLVAAEPVLVFPGGRRFSSVKQIVENSGRRFRRVKKHIERVEAWPGDGAVIVLISGTLHGEWPEGTPFQGIRFADRFEIHEGGIARQEVWNDAGEHMLARKGGWDG